MTKVFVVAAKRTPLGSFNGSLKSVPAAQLAAVAIKAAIKEAKIDPVNLDEVILGNVVGAGQGMGGPVVKLQFMPIFLRKCQPIA